MSHAIRVQATGGPEVLGWEQVPTPEPGPGQVLIHHAAIGVNFIDLYFRSGLYKTPLPMTPGMEASGTVLRLGAGVTDFAEGDRVAYVSMPLGAYAEKRVMPADRLVKLPETISFETAAGMMMRGLTAQFLLHRTYKVSPGETILVYAAAGGVGLVMCQWAKHIGAIVIGVVSSAEKAAIARAHGADHVLLADEDIPARVRDITQGAMVPVVYDSVGRDSFAASLDCLAPLGMMVSFGNASGAVPPVDISQLAAKGSLFLTRPSLVTYTAKRAALLAGTEDLFDVVQKGLVKIEVDQTFALKDAAEAHRALESRKTTGSTILKP
ncbi:quinone oxidoreductase [Acidisoma cellulosilytica]|uniref:Quinone oxidoreductase n=1 Tax=Acidisoma cellulosilyticum TaxID=2802395 RepID=A0A963Z2Q8_9PROT|nr:quinone oxidoreductase [Acidisoma cellulosilyticum]MCB8880872.1 quinone oxidoreductase [Acidisoma cellulosilyticum]